MTKLFSFFLACLLSTIASTANAAIPSSTGVFTQCYILLTGVTRTIDYEAGARCTILEGQIDFRSSTTTAPVRVIEITAPTVSFTSGANPAVSMSISSFTLAADEVGLVSSSGSVSMPTCNPASTSDLGFVSFEVTGPLTITSQTGVVFGTSPGAMPLGFSTGGFVSPLSLPGGRTYTVGNGLAGAYCNSAPSVGVSITNFKTLILVYKKA